MQKHKKIWIVALVLLAIVIAATGWYLHRHLIPVLQPAGEIGNKERRLMIFAASISLIVVIPVFTMLGVFAWRYRESNPRGRIAPSLRVVGLPKRSGGSYPPSSS